MGRRLITKPCRSKPLSSGIIIFFLRTLNSHIHIECLEYSEAAMIRARFGPRFRNFQIFIFNMPIQGFLWKLASSTGKGKKKKAKRKSEFWCQISKFRLNDSGSQVESHLKFHLIRRVSRQVEILRW